ncbi:pentapeptide repeat-containing protein [Streptomyces sp. NBC_01367]|uniref:pentapeptide repeat-containing protein n=1 Tax=Streptomyces sp. NBC_01367 TaxID=2903841 RepID=UPI003254213B
MNRKWFKRCSLAIAATLGIALWVVALWRVPWWLDRHFLTERLTSEQVTLVSGMRTALVALGAGALAVAGLFYTHHTLNVAREGHITDRITKAVEQLGSSVLEVRLGGIYALERIMRDSSKDHHAVVQVLAAFVREHGRSKPVDPAPNRPAISAFLCRLGLMPQNPSQLDHEPAKLAEDVQAALTVLARRPQGRGRPHPDIVDLSGACLRGAHLAGAVLQHANLKETNLECAKLYGARLEHAQMYKAKLAHANLSEAHLEHADLADACLRSAKLYRALLKCANLWGTQLDKAEGLDAYQVMEARPATTTLLPADIAVNARVQDRISRYLTTSEQCNPMRS